MPVCETSMKIPTLGGSENFQIGEHTHMLGGWAPHPDLALYYAFIWLFCKSIIINQ